MNQSLLTAVYPFLKKKVISFLSYNFNDKSNDPKFKKTLFIPND